MNRKAILALGALASVGVAELWHGPLGAANELQANTERRARNLLDYYELPQVTARMDDAPLTRRLILKGPADDFQRRALVEKVGELPGVDEVRWDSASPVIDNFPRRAAPPGSR
ncbi:hypothetical protein [Sphingomonas glaciei]|uniref:BON domain-containing protein n=1 Tax=Sphingomonas glaciei TaxID=2938948 RepID=A0ABY5MSH6_9SPHN|nr:hypothetical protein [Sphingomonas glaciei]UUR07450.1 hypothetical protein M1K48_10940 [Sphingomonas glaciei]